MWRTAASRSQSAAMSKPVLSSRLMGLKFMQRAAENEKKAEATEAAEQRDAEVSAVQRQLLSPLVVPLVTAVAAGTAGRQAGRQFPANVNQLLRPWCTAVFCVRFYIGSIVCDNRKLCWLPPHQNPSSLV